MRLSCRSVLCAAALLACHRSEAPAPSSGVSAGEEAGAAIANAKAPLPAAPEGGRDAETRAPSGRPEPLLDSLPPPSESTSIGSPTNGRVEGASALPDAGPGFRFNDRRQNNARFAAAEVVRALVRAAAAVERELPGSQLVVNDLGLREGGPIAHHGSHRAGRDADLLFFLLGRDGEPTPSVGAPLDPAGEGFDYKDLEDPGDDVAVRFDAPRTFRLVRALLEDPEATVQRIFVVEHLRARLIAEAERVRAPASLVQRLSEVTCQPGYAHDDHLHVRWYCSPEDLSLGCEDLPPTYPWRLALLRELGLSPIIARRGRARQPPQVVTEAEAKRRVQQADPHPSVLAFLKRRESWTRKPHPGRPFCK